MNTWLSPIVPYADVTAVESYYKDSDLVRPGPANIWVLLDENPYSINDASFICEPVDANNASDQWIDYPASYHNNSGGICFADGHAEIHPWKDKTVLNCGPSEGVQPGNPGFVRVSPSQDPPTDLAWLQFASTYVIGSAQ
jgi:prepilin-type processing-associated H-X9-DG protein